MNSLMEYMLFQYHQSNQSKATKKGIKKELKSKGKTFISPSIMIARRYLNSFGIELIKSLRLNRIPSLNIHVTILELPLPAFYS